LTHYGPYVYLGDTIQEIDTCQFDSTFSQKAASFPGLPIFFVFCFVSSIVHGSGRTVKNKKAWSHSSRELDQVDTRWR